MSDSINQLRLSTIHFDESFLYATNDISSTSRDVYRLPSKIAANGENSPTSFTNTHGEEGTINYKYMAIKDNRLQILSSNAESVDAITDLHKIREFIKEHFSELTPIVNYRISEHFTSPLNITNRLFHKHNSHVNNSLCIQVQSFVLWLFNTIFFLDAFYSYSDSFKLESLKLERPSHTNGSIELMDSGVFA